MDGSASARDERGVSNRNDDPRAEERHMSMLPELDVIPSLRCVSGMYSLKRWPETVGEQIKFLRAVAKRFCDKARMTLHQPHDGYPGYIEVVAHE